MPSRALVPETSVSTNSTIRGCAQDEREIQDSGKVGLCQVDRWGGDLRPCGQSRSFRSCAAPECGYLVGFGESSVGTTCPWGWPWKVLGACDAWFASMIVKAAIRTIMTIRTTKATILRFDTEAGFFDFAVNSISVGCNSVIWYQFPVAASSATSIIVRKVVWRSSAVVAVPFAM